MKAIFIHELKSYFHSLTAWVFAAFLLCFVGIGAMMYNIQAAVSNFEYVLSLSSLAFVVIAPILAMRVLAEERRQKTDQLLYALPVSTVEVILGKYAALLVLYLVPLAIIAVYPLIFAQFGEVYLPTSYGSLFAFFLLGAALLAVGMFISSLTDNQGLAAGIGIQNFPEGAAISLPLRQEGMGRGRAFLMGTASGLVEPVFALLTVLAAGTVHALLPWLLSFAAGCMLYVVVEELIPEASPPSGGHSGTLGVMVGFLLMMILDVALG